MILGNAFYSFLFFILFRPSSQRPSSQRPASARPGSSRPDGARPGTGVQSEEPSLRKAMFDKGKEGK